ncbi:hypothetical protein FBUS_10062 [Fasciolopsis buskii]|uniref:EF-hand domain-containing protein n=1 Tax=Fasciolopsis buskii TaxID=27845 RepID=A0A8E0VII8_9TREM|nr:hypothetical protein FBUS_10062 [Fasciolopsis buski]
MSSLQKTVDDIIQQLDVNGDGKLSKAELMNGLADEPQLVAKIQKFDADNDGTIDKEELLKWLETELQ